MVSLAAVSESSRGPYLSISPEPPFIIPSLYHLSTPSFIRYSIANLYSSQEVDNALATPAKSRIPSSHPDLVATRPSRFGRNAVTFGISVTVATILSVMRFENPPIPPAGLLPYPASKKNQIVAANP
ncbi:hypothetical protein EVAR_68068_1 [Eumeta japonica]|uniref:Uncharacterized protein n=1 Tax=Eumeta variegata TaxID=151549 RepID=A0A4C1T5A2_EUMVA|nr:hypothetical protein EVAR_68068_1 [Eumeta japonica]